MPINDRPAEDQPRPPDREQPVGRGSPLTEFQPPKTNAPEDLYVAATEASIKSVTGEPDDAEEDLGPKLLKIAAEAEVSADSYANYVRKGWQRSYLAFENKHFLDSKYNSKDYLARSKHFKPKTRAAVRKAQAAHAASLFMTKDAMSIEAGNEADKVSRAGAALMQEVVNYRTSRTSGRNAIAWFLTCMGAVQNGMLTGIVASKQSWLLKTKDIQREVDIIDQETGDISTATETVKKIIVDRPESELIPSENILIDAGADWRRPAQDSAFLAIKWPMKIDDIRAMEKDPQNPWVHLEESTLRTGTADRMTGNSRSTRTAREGGQDRYDRQNSSNRFQTIWVTEWYIRHDNEDYTFWAINGQHMLSAEVKTVDEVYPWTGGERPLSLGYASLEAHKIFPMSPVESWQPLQQEINDVANLTLDTVKMNIAPLAKVKRGRQVDLEKLRRRGPGTNLLMTSTDDVEFEKPPSVDSGAWQQIERLTNDFDSLAGQFDQSSVASSRNLNETVGGMRLLSGAANAVGEYDQRVLVETWVEPVLGQIVKLCQYYEHDETVLALCGDRANLWQGHGVPQITDELLDAQLNISIDLGIGGADPATRLGKFQMAAVAVQPAVEGNPKFATGEYEINVEEVFDACFGAVGFRDGGKRFLKINPPPPQQEDPKLAAEKMKAQAAIEKTQLDMKAAAEKHAMEMERLKAEMAMMREEMNMRFKEFELKRADAELQRKARDDDFNRQQALGVHKTNLERESIETVAKDRDAQHQQDMQARDADRKAKLEDREAERKAKAEDREAERKAKADEAKNKPKEDASKPAADALSKVLAEHRELMAGMVKERDNLADIVKEMIKSNSGRKRITKNKADGSMEVEPA